MIQKYTYIGIFLILGLSLGCDKNSSATPGEAADVLRAHDQARKVVPTSGKSPTYEDVPGVDTKSLDPKRLALFHKLADSLPSPCGGAKSLRSSTVASANCKRGRFAARYVVALLGDGADKEEVRELYDGRYSQEKLAKFSLEGVANIGPSDATVTLVEFFDYGCPACKQFSPLIDQIIADYPADVRVYFKHYPLDAHPESGPAAQLAVVAAKQGKFLQMHKRLFASQGKHKKEDLKRYAQQVGLNMKSLESNLAAAKKQVDADRADGDKVGVMGTPTLYINGRSYMAPPQLRYLKMWIEEEVAVNR